MPSASRTSRSLAPVAELPLRGAGGEPVSFARTVYSHGCAHLPPAELLGPPYQYALRVRVGARVVDVVLSEGTGTLLVRAGVRPASADARRIAALASRMFRLDDDLSPFYARIGGDALLSWAAAGAGRMLASPTVFEDVIKTICTTNCAWSATQRMVGALCALDDGAFPSAERLAATPPGWYRDVARMGYRGPFVRTIARDVAAGKLDLESLLPSAGRTDDDVEATLLALPGVGPYAAAHVMQMLGRHRRLVLDSWTRPKYARLCGKRRASDTTIRRAFARYGEYAGLAFWLYLTRDWLDGDGPTDS